jgi:hypothetical protein
MNPGRGTLISPCRENEVSMSAIFKGRIQLCRCDTGRCSSPITTILVGSAAQGGPDSLLELFFSLLCVES